jgi:hypothetical protein
MVNFIYNIWWTLNIIYVWWILYIIYVWWTLYIIYVWWTLYIIYVWWTLNIIYVWWTLYIIYVWWTLYIIYVWWTLYIIYVWWTSNFYILRYCTNMISLISNIIHLWGDPTFALSFFVLFEQHTGESEFKVQSTWSELRPLNEIIMFSMSVNRPYLSFGIGSRFQFL